MDPSPAEAPPVPETLEEALSSEWLTAALGTRFPGVDVSRVVPGPVVSRISTNARFRIECIDPVPPGLPLDLCVKGYFTEAGREARARGLPEAAFYRDVVDTTDVRTLPGVYADIDERTRNCVIVTEDVVAEGAEFLDTLSEYGPDQTAQSLEQFAKLHAATWMNPAYTDARWFTPWFSALTEVRGIPTISGNFEGPIGARVPDAVRDAQRLFDAFTAVSTEAMTASPWCLVHGDAHMANLFLDGRGRPSLVDWQLVQRGPWYIDVGYHLAATLDVEDRRRSEHDLVRHYLDCLRAGGVDVPAEADAWRGVRRGMVHGFYLWGITLVVDAHITTALLERLGTAVDDHDAFDL